MPSTRLSDVLSTATISPSTPTQGIRRPDRAVSHAQATRVPWLSIVIVNYRQWAETEALIEQILCSPNAKRGLVEVVVIDNDSRPDPVANRLRRREGVSLRCWKRNRGFARAVNEGIRLSRGHWLLVLNPDISVPARFVESVLEITARLPAIEPPAGIVGFRLCDKDGGWQRSTGAFPTLSGTFARLLLPRSRRKYNSPPNDRPTPVSWVTGCCMLLRRECWEQLKGFDRDYFLYYEDVDLCRRAQQAGWSVWYEPAISVVHHHPLHGRDVPAPLRVLTRHAFLIYCSKHWATWQLRVVARVVRWEARVRRWLATRRGMKDRAAQFKDLELMAAKIINGGHVSARRSLPHQIAL